MHHPKRRKKRPVHSLKTVEVSRGKSGYGFTISGQGPCVLSCIVGGSPAEKAGLKAGDYLMSVNGLDVSRYGHDDVVRMIGMSTGTLTIQVAENYNSSDSSDDEYPPRNKIRYPNRHRMRQTSQNLLRDNAGDGLTRSCQSQPRLHAPVGAEKPDHLGESHPSTPLDYRRPPTYLSSSDSKTNLITPQSQIGNPVLKKLAQSSSVWKVPRIPNQTHKRQHSSVFSDSTPELRGNVGGGQNVIDGKLEDEDDALNRACDIRVIVGYVGSIELPSESNAPGSRLQSLRNAVKRLRVEQKIHTLVLMEVVSDGVKLSNSTGMAVAFYPTNKLVFSGVCPDDKKFFGIVTSNNENGNAENGTDVTGTQSCSCHVFMVDPEMRAHNIHAHKAKLFHIRCTVDIDTRQCLEFPRSATPIILAITKLYKDRPGVQLDNDVARSHAFANPSRPPQRSNSNSSNSDSGLGMCRDDNNGNDRVCVVEVGPETHWPVDDGASNMQHLSPEVNTIPVSRQDYLRPVSAFSDKPRLNTSTSSDEILFNKHRDRLNVRVMPDPATLWHAHSADNLEKQGSADNLRMSMHKLLQVRERHASDHYSSSDADSNSSSRNNSFHSKSQNNLFKRPLSAPYRQLSQSDLNTTKVETIDLLNDKLSPRAMIPSVNIRSPSAPPFSLHDDSDLQDADHDMKAIIERFDRDKALGLAGGCDDVRRFSEGFVLSHRREKERKEKEELQKWTKTGSLRRQKGMKLNTTHSQSHESLIVVEQDISSQKLSTANSVNSIVHHVSKAEETPEVERVAGWAVNFDKLLKDSAGVAIFTDFLKKEFSEENILFWDVCESFKNIINPDLKQSKAKEIYNKHLSIRASDPVNIDSNARRHAENKLDNPSSDMFDIAQKQIYQLMKQDSYARFLKSDMYKSYLMKEMEGKLLDFTLLSGKSKDVPKENEKKKGHKGKENEEKRRRSLLPWKKGSKNNLKSAPPPATTEDKKSVNKEKESNQKKSTAGSGIDLSTMRKEVYHDEIVTEDEKNHKFCRVILPDGSTTVVCAKQGPTVRNVIGKLCEKRNLSVAAIDVFLLGSDRPLDLNDDICTLGSKEVIIEKRVLFRMDLPNRKSIGVKAKPNRSLRDVFKPILNKYGYRIESIAVHLSGDSNLLDIDAPVSSIDNQRVVVTEKDECPDWVNYDVRCKSSSSKPPLHRHSMPTATLEEITNQIFDNVMMGKSEQAHNFDELGVLDLDHRKLHKNPPEEHRLSNLFGRLRRDSAGTKEIPKQQKLKVTFNVDNSETKSRRNNTEDEKLFDLLNKAQRHRLDDQRGLSKETMELPEFLKERKKEPPDLDSSQLKHKQVIHAKRASSSKINKEHVLRSAEKSFSKLPSPINVSSDVVDNISYLDSSFAHNGYIPSNKEADGYFAMNNTFNSPDFNNPLLTEKSLKDIGFDYSFNEYNNSKIRRYHVSPQDGKTTDKSTPVSSPEQYSPNKTITGDSSHDNTIIEQDSFHNIPSPTIDTANTSHPNSSANREIIPKKANVVSSHSTPVISYETPKNLSQFHRTRKQGPSINVASTEHMRPRGAMSRLSPNNPSCKSAIVDSGPIKIVTSQKVYLQEPREEGQATYV